MLRGFHGATIPYKIQAGVRPDFVRSILWDKNTTKEESLGTKVGFYTKKGVFGDKISKKKLIVT